MPYEKARSRAVKDAYFTGLSDFLNDYIPGHPTILFIPGGMGSQLMRSDQRFVGGDSLPPTTKFDVTWFDLGLLFGRDLDYLCIKKDRHDLRDHIVVPDGEIRFLFKPYDGTKKFFCDRGYNYLVFGFDWRRPLTEGAGYLEYFLKDLRVRTQARFGEDPLPRLSIIGHSQGGLILQLWLIRMFRGNPTPQRVDRWFNLAICVGTPFYGTTNHMERYYKGETAFTMIRDHKTLVKITSSMPGPYVLMPMDAQTYRMHEARFHQFGLNRYPVRDGRDPIGSEADPFDAANFDRYPGWVNRQYLNNTKALRRTLRLPLSDAVLARLYNLRSVANTDTPVEIRWDPVVGGNVKPGDAPLVKILKGPGDGTVPAWSGALCQLPDHHIVDLKKVEGHVALMEHEETLESILHIMKHGAVADRHTPPGGTVGITPASKTDLDQFLGDIAAERISREDTRASDPAIWRRIMEEGFLC